MATFTDLQEKNRRKTRVIVVCFVLFFIWLGAGLDLARYYWSGGNTRFLQHYYGLFFRSHPQVTTGAGPVHNQKHFQPIFTLLVGFAGVGLAWWSLSNASENVLTAMCARRASKNNSPEEQMLINVVEEMCIAASMRPPKVWIIPDPDPNALAVGLEEGDYHVAVTEGLLRALNRDELQGVIGHELAHLKNQDTRLMTALTVLVGLAALISEFVSRNRYCSVDVRGGNDDDNKMGALIFGLWFFTVLLAPLATQLMAMLVSREREYLADASSAQFTRNPEALASALDKISSAVAPTALVKPASAHLCIASPTASDLSYDCESDWFATHPPIKSRIHRLNTIGANWKAKAAREAASAG
ncbi:M48 family metallopeptidase [Geomonas sp. Red32]|uniref:M48 family metallopeptidase n=1 Tax=Geomonas sp. Red32 TaxID=2912856 RepID=UPI00202CB1CE|nr:M48 family metallopeptidase [Geomonas sp. Red32]MCM0080867.1 M48 family metallopeptidase [Geomonas sp. Red32]